MAAAALRKTCYLTLALIVTGLANAASSTSLSSSPYVKYSTVTGYFLQDLNSTDASTFDYVSGTKKKKPLQTKKK